MSHRFADIAFTPAVQELQKRHGSRAQYARMQASGDAEYTLGPHETEFLAQADSFCLATVSETGWPYVMPDYKAKVERLAIIDVAAFDWNCPQHITQRFTLEQVEAASRPLHERISQLEEQLRATHTA